MVKFLVIFCHVYLFSAKMSKETPPYGHKKNLNGKYCTKLITPPFNTYVDKQIFVLVTNGSYRLNPSDVCTVKEKKN